MSADATACGFEEWREFARPFFDVIPTGERSAFRAEATSRKLGPLVVSEVAFDAAVFDRDPARLRGYETEFLLLETYSRGENRGRSGDRVTSLETGSVHVHDMARPWLTRSTGVKCRSVVIPYTCIGYDPGRGAAYAKLPAGSARTSMVLSAMDALVDVGDDVAPRDADALAEGFAMLVRRLMFDRSDPEAERAHARIGAAFLGKFIDEHLDEADLGPERLCRDLGVSRATLYRILHDEGGVRGCIAARRLDRCFDDLRRGPVHRGRVGEVARRWGFIDSKAFNRAFRARFGIAPSDCLDRPVDGERAIVSHAVNDWMRHL